MQEEINMAACAVMGLYFIVILIIYRAIEWICYGISKKNEERGLNK